MINPTHISSSSPLWNQLPSSPLFSFTHTLNTSPYPILSPNTSSSQIHAITSKLLYDIFSQISAPLALLRTRGLGGEGLEDLVTCVKSGGHEGRCEGDGAQLLIYKESQDPSNNILPKDSRLQVFKKQR